jgi:mono/diheme cytochrome c family protein
MTPNRTSTPTLTAMLAGCAATAFALWLTSAPAAAANPATPTQARAAGTSADAISVERGRYVAKIAGCNDCHTAGYAPTGGAVPEKEWLKGDGLGWNGPWGTTYAPNLRIFMSRGTEDQWVHFARSAQLRPPMPWFALRDMSEADLRSLYRFVRSLGAVGEPAPAYLPPGVEPKGPHAKFVLPPPAAETAKGGAKAPAHAPAKTARND